MWSTLTARVPDGSAGLLRAASRAGEAKANTGLPTWAYVIAGILTLCGCFSANPELTPFAILTLLAIGLLLLRKGEPPTLAFACVIQWLQASVTIFYTDFNGISVEQAGGSVQFETATWLSLFGVLALAVGMRVALIGCKRSEGTALLGEALCVDVSRAFAAYWVCLVLGLVAAKISSLIPGAAQPLGALISLKWVMVFILTCTVLEQRVGYGLLLIVVFVELAVGVLGFFSAFKNVFFVLLVAAVTSAAAFRGRRLMMTLTAAAGLIFFSVVWSAIKAEYRDFLNQGSGEQVILVSTEDSADELSGLISRLSWSSFTSGFENLVLRVGYTNLFALTLGNVPDRIPYENGSLWFEALDRMAKPRIFFPDKAAVDDSERATLYTGVSFAGAEQGSSVGIGYMAESYVDFGPIGMFAPILVLGVFFGLIYRVFVIWSRRKLLGAGIATAIITFNGYAIETSNIKIVGGAVTTLLGFGLLLFVFGAVVQSWLLSRPSVAGQHGAPVPSSPLSRGRLTR